MLKKISIVVAIILCLSFSLFAQTTTKQIVSEWKSKIFEYGANKYGLQIMENGRHINFENKFDLEITAFQLGCVKREKGLIKLFSERPLVNESIQKGEATFWSSNHGFFPIEECKKGKLAIIEVRLKNGEIWKLN